LERKINLVTLTKRKNPTKAKVSNQTLVITRYEPSDVTTQPKPDDQKENWMLVLEDDDDRLIQPQMKY
jgi:hypothetical protein